MVAWGTPLAALVLVWALHLTGTVPVHPLGLLVATAAGLASVLLAAGLSHARPAASTLRQTFNIQALGIVVMVAAWLIAVAL